MKERLAAAALTVGLITGCGAEGLHTEQDMRGETIADLQTGLSELPHVTAEYDVSSYDGRVYNMNLSLQPELLQPLSESVRERVLQSIVRVKGNMVDDQVGAGSGFLMTDTHGETSVITAAHVMNDMIDKQVVVIDNNKEPVLTDYFDSYLQKPEPGVGGREDIAIGHLPYPHLYEERALLARDIENNPMKPGEQVYLINYQQGHTPGEPAEYSMIYAGDIEDNRISELIGDMMPQVEEDDMRPGSSGGVIVDNEGRVVGMSFATSNYEKSVPLVCGDRVFFGTTSLNDVDVNTGVITLPAEGDECDKFVSNGFARMIQYTGYFAVHEDVPLVTIDVY